MQDSKWMADRQVMTLACELDSRHVGQSLEVHVVEDLMFAVYQLFAAPPRFGLQVRLGNTCHTIRLHSAAEPYASGHHIAIYLPRQPRFKELLMDGF